MIQAINSDSIIKQINSQNLNDNNDDKLINRIKVIMKELFDKITHSRYKGKNCVRYSSSSLSKLCKSNEPEYFIHLLYAKKEDVLNEMFADDKDISNNTKNTFIDFDLRKSFDKSTFNNKDNMVVLSDTLMLGDNISNIKKEENSNISINHSINHSISSDLYDDSYDDDISLDKLIDLSLSREDYKKKERFSKKETFKIFNIFNSGDYDISNSKTEKPKNAKWKNQINVKTYK